MSVTMPESATESLGTNFEWLWINEVTFSAVLWAGGVFMSILDVFPIVVLGLGLHLTG